MTIPYYQVDSFTSEVFGGNPACVVPLNEWLEDAVLLKIAQENAVAETAFFIETSNGFKLRSSDNAVNGTSYDPYIYMAWADVPFKYNNTLP